MRILASIKINSNGIAVTQTWETTEYKNKNYLVFNKTEDDFFVLVPYDSLKVGELDMELESGCNSYQGILSLEDAIVEQIKD